MKTYFGLNKSPDQASVCRWESKGKVFSAEILLKERFTKKKSDGAPVDLVIQSLFADHGRPKKLIVAENSYYSRPAVQEEEMNRLVPYYDLLKRRGLSVFFSHFNKRLKFVPHHLCHAMAALAISPFDKSLIVVMDCTGNNAVDFPVDHQELKVSQVPIGAKGETVSEACTVYVQRGKEIFCVRKNWQIFRKVSVPGKAELWVSGGLGKFYEVASQFIFNSVRESGKVMGLAAFGKPKSISDREDFLLNLDWTKAFQKKGKKDWEASPHFKLYADIAATVQNHFEHSIDNLMDDLRLQFPEIKNLIFTGGCALNCISNMKLNSKGRFKRIFVPPFPGDESISLGAAALLKFSAEPESWEKIPLSRQRANFGSVESCRIDRELSSFLRKNFRRYSVSEVTKIAARELSEGKIIAWYQGRSESGPRALGNRSILADPRISGLKDRLNTKLKFREDFRPYGCSCIKEMAPIYFDVPENFDSPFMSFAPKVRPRYRETLREVSQVDFTSRVQTVSRSRTPRFFFLLQEFSKISGLGCLLNTSMNVMGEPIIETPENALEFLFKSSVDGLILEHFFIKKSEFQILSQLDFGFVSQRS